MPKRSLPIDQRTRKERDQDELANNKVLKPKLAKFLIDAQRAKAEEVSKQKTEDDKWLLSSNEVIERAGHLACVALLQMKIWQTMPPFLSMEWTIKGTNQQQYAQEMHQDISGFATYLCREYNTFIKFKASGKGYPNPMQEEQISFFWAKFNADLKLLIEAERRRVAAGNTSVILHTHDKPSSSGLVLPDSSIN